MKSQPNTPEPVGPIPPLNPRFCRGLGTAAALCGGAFLTINAVMWLVPEMAPYAARGTANLQDDPIKLTPLIKAIGLLGSTLYFGVLARSLFIARTLLRRLADGLVFEPETGMLMRRFGRSLVTYAALTPPAATAMAWLITMLNPPGQRLLRFGFTNYEVVLAIIGMIILTTGSVMAEATRIADDHRQIV
jgi:Protein of unknown function (DUF2975)